MGEVASALERWRRAVGAYHDAMGGYVSVGGAEGLSTSVHDNSVPADARLDDLFAAAEAAHDVYVRAMQADGLSVLPAQ